MSQSHRVEVVAGVTTFLTMSYIAVVNPSILSVEGTGLPFAAVMTATVLVAAVSSIAMGLFARLPYALAPGMGLNAFVTYSLILGDGMSGVEALGAVVASGVIFVLLSATPAREAVARAVPATLRHGAAAGIGLFLAFLGLKNAGVVVANPATLVSFGPLSGEMAIFAAGIALTAVLAHRRIIGSYLVGMAAMTCAAHVAGLAPPVDGVWSTPDLSLVGRFELGAVLAPAAVGPLLTLLLTDLFDSLSTLLGVAHAANLVDEQGQPVRLGRALIVDAAATLISGVAGTSPATTYVESAAGIREGGRTGVTAVVAGLCFVPLLFLAPLAAAVPPCATAPVLVLVGVSMLTSVRHLGSGEDLIELVPAALTVLLIPLTFSITQGLVWGVLSHLLLLTLSGRARQAQPALWCVGLLCAVVLVVA